MLSLHQLPPLDRARSLSPFCKKVETYLRMSGIPYESVRLLDSSQGPKGKLPFIEEDGKRLGDSYFIIEHLEATHGTPVDGHLSREQRAIALAFSRMLDEHTYWAIVHSRWFDDRFSPRMEEIFLGALPAEQRIAVAAAVRDAFARTMHGHGIGRHTPDEIAARAKADLTALADLLADRPYMLGERPSTLDACAYAFLSSIIDVDMDTTLKRHAGSHANLVAYCERMRARYYATE